MAEARMPFGCSTRSIPAHVIYSPRENKVECKCTPSPSESRHPYNHDAMWVELYCGIKPCSECPRGDVCEDYDGAMGGMPETFNPHIYR